MHCTSRRLAILLDWVILLLAVLAGFIVLTGGFILHVSSFDVRFRSVDRTLMWLTATVLIRSTAGRHTLPFGVARERLSTLRPPLTVPPGVEYFRVRLGPRAWRDAAAATLGLAGAVALLLRDQISHPFSVADLGDPLFSIWRIGWINHTILGDPAHLFDANIFYPEPFTLAFSDPMLLAAFMARPLALLGTHPVVVYNILLIIAFWFSGIAAYLLVHRLTASARAGFVAGLLFACCSYRFEHYSHLELQLTFWIPLGLIALHLFIATGRWSYALALALAWIAQLYSSMYYAVFFLVYATVAGAVLIAIQRTGVRRYVLPTAAATAVAAVIAIPLARPFLAAEPLSRERPVTNVLEFSATPADYLRTNKHSAIWGGYLSRGERERGLFPGLAPIVLGVIGLAPPFSALRSVYVAAGLVAYDASLGLNGLLYQYLSRWLMPVRRLRAPARFSVLVDLTLSILGGFGALRILQQCRSRGLQHAALALIASGIMVDAWPTLDLVAVDRTPPAIYEDLSASTNVVLAELPVLEDAAFNTPYMYFSLWHWRPMVNGYSGHLPRSYNELLPALKDFPRGDAPSELRKRGVTHVTLNCGLQYVPCEDIRRLMRGSHDLRIVSGARWRGQQVELYELLR